jgi:hypothetical protein
MKFALTKYELFALTSHLVVQPSPNPEHGRKRLRAWDELGVADLADNMATMQGVGGELQISEWRDKKTPHLVELTGDVLDYLLAGLSVQVNGVWADTLTRLRERLGQLRDKKYRLPPELRELKAVAP